jgi:hypothetical protein
MLQMFPPASRSCRVPVDFSNETTKRGPPTVPQFAWVRPSDLLRFAFLRRAAQAIKQELRNKFLVTIEILAVRLLASKLVE